MGILLSLDIIGTYGFYAIQQDLLTNSGESLALAASDIAGKLIAWHSNRLRIAILLPNPLTFYPQGLTT